MEDPSAINSTGQLSTELMKELKRSINMEKIIEFDIGEISDPITQNIINLKGNLPQLGTYFKPNPERRIYMENFLTEYLEEELDIPWREDQLEGDSSYVHGAVSMIAAFNSLDTINTEAALGASFFAICFLYTDDILDKIKGFNTGCVVDSNISQIIFDTVTHIIEGKYTDMDSLAKISLIPSLDPVLKLVFVGSEFLTKSIPNFRNRCKYFCKAFNEDWRVTVLMKEHNFIESCSDEVYKLLRGKDVAARTTIEIGLLLNNVTLEDNLRLNSTVNLLIDLVAITVGLVNDIIGIQNELFEGDVSNLVLRLVRRNKIPLTQAFDDVLQLVKIQMNDINLLCEKLKQDIPNNNSIDEFLLVIQNFVNGHVYFYDYNQRYGYVKISSIEK